MNEGFVSEIMGKRNWSISRDFTTNDVINGIVIDVITIYNYYYH
jgi:hypothetical protein